MKTWSYLCLGLYPCAGMVEGIVRTKGNKTHPLSPLLIGPRTTITVLWKLQGCLSVPSKGLQSPSEQANYSDFPDLGNHSSTDFFFLVEFKHSLLDSHPTTPCIQTLAPDLHSFPNCNVTKNPGHCVNPLLMKLFFKFPNDFFTRAL